MDGSTLNVAAPVFKPGGGAASAAPTARQPSPLQMPPAVSGPATPLEERNGPPSHAFQPAMVSSSLSSSTIARPAARLAVSLSSLFQRDFRSFPVIAMLTFSTLRLHISSRKYRTK